MPRIPHYHPTSRLPSYIKTLPRCIKITKMHQDSTKMHRESTKMHQDFLPRCIKSHFKQHMHPGKREGSTLVFGHTLYMSLIVCPTLE
ncbi:hypothetical protein Pmani_027490 [Petrolisthes manimaculis]|uniref:Uncharacterized protein n=1 Tax=Petrolisthes manimaculis TaxID=1843537 RepID=A0AAE1TZ15_9EUCA|nr:hypothetical protein Pmani_027490 [Petrolisthes manimaculis]